MLTYSCLQFVVFIIQELIEVALSLNIYSKIFCEDANECNWLKAIFLGTKIKTFFPTLSIVLNTLANIWKNFKAVL